MNARTSLYLSFKFPLNSRNKGPYVFANQDGQKMELLGFLQTIIHQVDDLKPKNNSTNFGIDCKPENIFIGEEKLQHLHISGRMEKYEQSVSVLSIFCYSKDKSSTSKEDAVFVQKLGMAQSEIIGHQDDVSIIIDCSSMDLPINTFLSGFSTDFGRIINMESLELVGIDAAFKGRVQMKFDMMFHN